MKKCLPVYLLMCLTSVFAAHANTVRENSFQSIDRQISHREECDWVFEQMEVHQAWTLMKNRGIAQPGRDITMVQLDTGIIPIQSLLMTRAFSSGQLGLQIPQTKSGNDPFNLVQTNAPPLDNNPSAPSFGHGTSTASLLIGWWNDTGVPGLEFRGIAPWLRLIPIKVTESVVMVGNMSTHGTADLKNLAHGIKLATGLGADVISISLGGLFDQENLVKKAIDDALERGIVVVAAGGQTFPINIIPLPARLPGVIAVTASTRDKKPWSEGFFGKHIAWAVPGADICHIKAKILRGTTAPPFMDSGLVRIQGRDGEELSFTDTLVTASGTSYSTAITAAAASLWLQYHSPEFLRQRYGRKNISALFAAMAKRHAMDTPESWQREKHGEGILNIRRLIEAPLPCNADDSQEVCKVKMGQFLNFTPR